MLVSNVAAVSNVSKVAAGANVAAVANVSKVAAVANITDGGNR